MLAQITMNERRSNERGGVIAEFAIVLPVALLLLLGAVDFGRVWMLATATANAAQAGAQYGAQSVQLSADVTGMRTAAINDLTASTIIAASNPGENGIEITDFVITPERYCECSNGTKITCTNKCGGGTNPMVFVRVRIDTNFDTLFDYPGIPNQVQISRAAVMRAR